MHAAFGWSRGVENYSGNISELLRKVYQSYSGKYIRVTQVRYQNYSGKYTRVTQVSIPELLG
jgi:hypothetical protein